MLEHVSGESPTQRWPSTRVRARYVDRRDLEGRRRVGIAHDADVGRPIEQILPTETRRLGDPIDLVEEGIRLRANRRSLGIAEGAIRRPDGELAHADQQPARRAERSFPDLQDREAIEGVAGACCVLRMPASRAADRPMTAASARYTGPTRLPIDQVSGVASSRVSSPSEASSGPRAGTASLSPFER